MLKIDQTDFDDLLVLTTPSYFDNRGYFHEIYNQSELYRKIKLNFNFCQDNLSYSKKNVLRGMHYQLKFPQTKLVYVTFGKIQDVALDLRKNSKTYGKYYSIILSSKNNKKILIPKGFAHGFLVLSKFAIVSYKVDEKYYDKMQRTIFYNDSKYKIKWLVDNNKIILSQKDNPLFYKK